VPHDAPVHDITVEVNLTVVPAVAAVAKAIKENPEFGVHIPVEVQEPIFAATAYAQKEAMKSAAPRRVVGGVPLGVDEKVAAKPILCVKMVVVTVLTDEVGAGVAGVSAGMATHVTLVTTVRLPRRQEVFPVGAVALTV